MGKGRGRGCAKEEDGSADVLEGVPRHQPMAASLRGHSWLQTPSGGLGKQTPKDNLRATSGQLAERAIKKGYSIFLYFSLLQFSGLCANNVHKPFEIRNEVHNFGPKVVVAEYPKIFFGWVSNQTPNTLTPPRK